MSKLTDEQINTIAAPWSWVNMNYSEEQKKFARAIESASTEPLLQRIAELEEMNAQLREQNTEVDKSCAELERQLEEARKDAKPCPTCESLARAVMLDQTGKA